MTSAKGRGRSTSIDHLSPHNRVTSLSIARSPSILSTSNPLEPFASGSTDNYVANDAYPPTGAALSRTVSYPPTLQKGKPKPALSDISSEEDLPTKGSGFADIVISRDGSRRGSRVTGYGGGVDGETYSDRLSSDVAADDEESGSGGGYAGGFQKPDSKEMLAIMLSLGGVALLSLAAGFTTIYDWVL